VSRAEIALEDRVAGAEGGCEVGGRTEMFRDRGRGGHMSGGSHFWNILN